MNDDEITSLTASEVGQKLRDRSLSPVEVTRAHLDRIEAHNRTYNAFITVSADRALTAAKQAEQEIATGRYRGPLHGIPFGAKDIFDTAGVRTTYGSILYRDNVPSRTAESVDRLERSGAVLLGKCNTHEFAAGSTTINRSYGIARNPWDLERIVGGSSGGSACALAARMIPLALGSDTGGSIRTPAALCGVVGIKPTMGRISLRGVYPNVPTIDHAGPMARTVTDAALALQVMSGYDPLDPKSIDMPVPDFTKDIEEGVRGARLAVSPDFTQNAEIDAEIEKAFLTAVAVFRDLGAIVEEVSFDGAERFADLFRRIAGPEFSETHRANFAEHPDTFDPEVRERLEWSLQIPLDDYVRALRERELVIREVARLLEPYDAMLSPTVPVTAAQIGSRLSTMNGREVDYKNLHRPFLSPHNLTGCPAMTLTMGFDRQGLPMGIQIASGHWSESDMLRVARAYEAATPELRSKKPTLM